MSENLPTVKEEDGSQARVVQSVSRLSVEAYSGAVPPPDIMEAYEKYTPGAANRFLKMAEQEQRNRLANNDKLIRIRENEIESQLTEFRWGIGASLTVMIILFVFMFYCAYLRLESVLIAALGVPLLSAIGNVILQFMWRKKGK